MNILYITYDGLTDFIGQSQILPYLAGCADAHHRLTVISFEKPDRMALLGETVAAECSSLGIDWRPQRFRARPPYLSKWLDQRAMTAASLQAGREADLVHCRSYVAARAGLAVKRAYGIPMLFDMRGFWPDQRREGGRWTESSLIGRALYSRWKSLERAFIAEADHIVVLAEAARTVVKSMTGYSNAPVSVIPCCADFTQFRLATPASRAETRTRLGIPASAPVLAYLGSIGSVYRIGDHLRLFDAIRTRHADARLLFVGRDSADAIRDAGAKAGVDVPREALHQVSAERSDVAYWLGAADVGGCFITPTASSRGVSPTKLGEYLACGIPVIANRGIGDVERLLALIDGGEVIPDFSLASLDAAAAGFDRLRALDKAALRERARPFLDLPPAIAAYRSIYDRLDVAVEVGA